MNGTATGLVRFGAGLLGLVSVGWILTGHAAKPEERGFPTDWSHRHLIFSRPATPERASRVERDPRYWQQWVRRNAVRVLSEDGSAPVEGHPIETGPLVAGRAGFHRDWSENLGSGANLGADNYPAKFSNQNTTANCASALTPDFVVFTTGLLGSSSQATVAAYDNLYSGCSGIVPTTYWAYNTGGKVLTATVLSEDGTQVAFVQTNGGFGSLVLLKWAASSGTVGAPITLTAVSNAAYRACTAPCMTTITLRDQLGTATDDTTSSAFPDYQHDILWVGGASSWLHKIVGAFRGTPAEIRNAGGFPVQVFPGNPTPLTSPVYDSASGNIFVGDLGGYFHRVNSTTGVATRSNQLDHGTGLTAGPIVDSTAGKVYIFSSNDGTTSCVGGSACSAVYLFGTSFSAGASGPKVAVGASSATPSSLYEGDFDSTYADSANATGNLYMCGNTGGPPIIYRVPINAGVMSTAVAGPVLANAATGCSPMTDVPNPNATGGHTEWIFASVQASGLSSVCAAAGCVMNFKNTPRLASTAYAAGQEVLDSNFNVQVVSIGGTSGTGTPAWNAAVAGTTVDGGVTWFNQGAYVASIAPWKASTSYAVGTEVVGGSNTVELCTHAGTSKATAPTWNAVLGGSTNEGAAGPHWQNLGPLATRGIKSTGGSSGIIMDNTVNSGGGSQVYYSTQSNQACATGGTGGCAVQASQSALQ